MTNSIVVIDSGVANLRSVANALTHLGVSHTFTQDPADLHGADKVILPGVGAFAAGMRTLRDRGFIQPLRDLARQGTPIFGICLGMHFLFEHSEEMGEYEGLGLLPGTVVRFATKAVKVPHIGWNRLNLCRPSALLNGINEGSYAYFVHSFHAAVTDPSLLLATADYDGAFPAIVNRGNVYGAQFHPEKSHATGLRLLKNFVELA